MVLSPQETTMSRREDKVRDEARRSLGLPDAGFYAGLRYCGTCPSGPLLLGDGTCPVCKGKDEVKFKETPAAGNPPQGDT